MVLDTSKKTTWDESEVEWSTDYDAYCYLFFLAKDKRKKGHSSLKREREKKTGLKAQKHLCSSSR